MTVHKGGYMHKEYETQVLDTDTKAIIEKLRELGAEETPEVFQKRWVFDINPNGCHEWIRIRTNGKKSTICYKTRTDHSVGGTEELEVEVDDFEQAAELMSNLKFYIDKFYQENRRHAFALDGIEFTIDTWPMIPPVLEIEAKSEANVKKGLKLLGLEGKDHGHHGYIAIYKKYGIDLHKHKVLKFE
jgi:adenylate cyclase class 2